MEPEQYDVKWKMIVEETIQGHLANLEQIRNLLIELEQLSSIGVNDDPVDGDGIKVPHEEAIINIRPRGENWNLVVPAQAHGFSVVTTVEKNGKHSEISRERLAPIAYTSSLGMTHEVLGNYNRARNASGSLASILDTYVKTLRPRAENEEEPPIQLQEVV